MKFPSIDPPSFRQRFLRTQIYFTAKIHPFWWQNTGIPLFISPSTLDMMKRKIGSNFLLAIGECDHVNEEERIMKRLSSSGPNFQVKSRRLFLGMVLLNAFLWGAIFSPAGTPGLQAAEKSVDLSTAIIKVAQKAMPSVVYIEVTQRQEVANPFWQFEQDPFFRRFFNVPKMPRKFRRELKGLGSGIIIDSQGHILTNSHVAGGASKMEVVTADGNRYPGTLVGVDPQTDLAVIKIAAKEQLPYLTFADSDKVEVGEWVVAIGAPRALEKSVTQGIISAKHRRGITEPTSYQDFLQTDAPINPGNSGGPLLNLEGEVVGVNAAIATESGGFEGIGFTIPSNMAVHVCKQLIAHGKVQRGWLGVSIQNLTPELAKSAHVESLKGAYVAEVVQGGPADKAGMKKGDVIIAYEGKEIPDAATLRNAVAETPIGQEKKFTVWRDGKKEGLTVRIGNLEESTKLLASVVHERLGITVRPVSSEEVAKYGLKPDQGVAIVTVEPKGPLGEAGFEVADIILDIDGQSVEGYDRFVNLVSLLRPKQQIKILALDHRTGNVGYVEATVR
jgi:serine protease Do